MTARRRDRGGPGRPGLALLAVAILVPGCGGDDGGGTEPLSDSVYVEVMARLVVLDSALSPAPEAASGAGGRADSLRARILESRGVDADQLLDYARTRGASPERMETVWQRVDELSDSLAAADWTPPGTSPDGPPSGEAAGDSARAPADSAGDGPADRDSAGDGGSPARERP